MCDYIISEICLVLCLAISCLEGLVVLMESTRSIMQNGKKWQSSSPWTFEGPNSGDNNVNNKVFRILLVSHSRQTRPPNPHSRTDSTTFKETIMSLHSGTPASGTSQRSEPRLHRCNKTKATTTGLENPHYQWSRSHSQY